MTSLKISLNACLNPTFDSQRPGKDNKQHLTMPIAILEGSGRILATAYEHGAYNTSCIDLHGSLPLS